MRTITMMELRSSPGEIFHEVHRHNQTFIITKAGKPIAQLCPLQTSEIKSNGKVVGAVPLTFRNPELLK